MGEQQKQKRTYSYVLKLKNLEERRHANDRHLTNAADQNIIHSDLQRQGAGGRLQIGTLAGFRSEQVAAFELDCMADIVGTRTGFDPYITVTSLVLSILTVMLC
jgi:hypothetical protein